MHAQQTVPEASGAWQAAAGRAADVMVPQVQQERDAASAAAQQQLRQLQQERDAARAQLVSARQAADDSMHSADAASLSVAAARERQLAAERGRRYALEAQLG
jgi:hypothetical protein